MRGLQNTSRSLAMANLILSRLGKLGSKGWSRVFSVEKMGELTGECNARYVLRLLKIGDVQEVVTPQTQLAVGSVPFLERDCL